MEKTPVTRALLSVSDKTGIVDFAKQLVACGVKIISTGGTSQALTAAGIVHDPVESITGLASLLDGRVKTLHPKIHGGILGRRDVHAEEAAQHGIPWIDLVVVNFYPFTQNVTDLNLPWDKVVEYIDIGGPTMVRAAAKNFAWVGVVTDPNDYARVIQSLENDDGLNIALKQDLAMKAFRATAHYEAAIANYFQQRLVQPATFANAFTLQLEKLEELRYGENPHQKACSYHFTHEKTGILSAKQHQGKPLSYNNILDAEAAWTTVSEFIEPACVIVKHANPCGVAIGKTINEAYERAYHADSLSAFGGIVALNQPCTKGIAQAIAEIFMEVVIAPEFTQEALNVFATKPNLRVLTLQSKQSAQWEMKFITGGLLLQERDSQLLGCDGMDVVTKAIPSDEDLAAMQFAWRVLKHIKSNGILIAKNNQTVGIGAGQVSRIDAVDLAIRKANGRLQGAILASDAFFPFRDSIDKLAGTGVKAIIQPGGSVRDEEVIAACNEHGIAMVFTGKRCFKH